MRIETLNRIRAGALCASRVLAVAFLVAFAVAVLGGCDVAMPPRTVIDCQVGHVAGRFETTAEELEGATGDELVTLYRGERVFMFPVSRIVACEQRPSPEPGQ